MFGNKDNPFENIASGQPYQPNPQFNNPPQPRPYLPEDDGKKFNWGVVVLILVFLLIAGGAGAGYYYYRMMTKPENIVKQMFANMVDVKAVQTQMNLNMTVRFPSGSLNRKVFDLTPNFDQANIKIAFSGKVDNLAENDRKIDGTVTLQTEDMGDFDFDVDLDIKNNNKLTFLRLPEFPAVIKENAPLEQIGFLENQWIKIDYAELEKEYGVTINKLKKIR
jgi:hypothetical protein